MQSELKQLIDETAQEAMEVFSDSQYEYGRQGVEHMRLALLHKLRSRAGSDALTPCEAVAWKDVRNELAVAMVGLLLNQQANTATGADFERLLDRLADEGRGAIHKLKHAAPAPAQSAGSDAVRHSPVYIDRLHWIASSLREFSKTGTYQDGSVFHIAADMIDEFRTTLAAPAPEPEGELSAAFNELAKQQERPDPEFARILFENRDALYITQAEQPERGELPELPYADFYESYTVPEDTPLYTEDQMREFARQAVAKDRAERQLAPVDETRTTPVASLIAKLGFSDEEMAEARVRVREMLFPAVDEEAERELFEAWAKPLWFDSDRLENMPGTYTSAATSNAWFTWKARAALATAGGDKRKELLQEIERLQAERNFAGVKHRRELMPLQARVKSLEGLVAHYRAKDAERLEAVNTLESERAANAKLTAELADSSRLAEAARKFLHRGTQAGVLEELRQALAQYEGKE